METIREILEELCRKNGGQLTPALVLSEARKKKSPLHSHFTWDDGEAAEAWRLNQAAYIIRRVKVRIEVQPEKQVTVRAFLNVTPPATESEKNDDETEDDVTAPSGYYVPVRVAMTEFREQVLASATAELRNVRRKYAHLEELAAVWEAVDSVSGKASP